MKWVIPFRTLLQLAFGVLLLCFLLAPGWAAYRFLQDQVMADQKADLFQHLNFINDLMTRKGDWAGTEDLQEWLGSAARSLGIRITYVAEDGRVVADSHISFADIKGLEDFSGRPEIAQAMKEGTGFIIRHSRIMQREEMFAARHTRPGGDLPAGVLRVAQPASAMQSLLGHTRNLFLGSFLAACGASFLLTHLFIRRLRRVLDSFARAATDVAQRNHPERLHFQFGHEFCALAEAFNRMSEAVDRTLEAVTEEKQQLEAVFQGMNDGVMVLDSRGRIHSVNRAFSNLLPTGTQILGRRPLEVIVSLELQEACNRALEFEREPGAPEIIQITLNSGRSYEVSVTRLPEQLRDMGLIVVFHDLTELKRLEKVRQDFVANVSHELRTPLTSIKGYTETLLAEPRADEQTTNSFLEVILKNTNHMVKMVDDLLQLARIEARQVVFKPSPVDPADALEAAWKSCLPLAEARRVRLINEIPEEGIRVSADYDQLVRVFRNLLENGIRFSPEGEALTVGCYTGADQVTFTVADAGPGIPKQHQHRIFERFYRIEKHRGAHFGSTGLGLAICRHIILNHGGRIWVESPRKGRKDGAAFFFTLFAAGEKPQG